MGQIVPKRPPIATDFDSFYAAVDRCDAQLAALESRRDRSGEAQCDYCRRFGPLGACEGCGAPNKPVNAQRPDLIVTAVGQGILTPNEARRLLGIWKHGEPRRPSVLPAGVNVVPVFGTVKR